MSGETKNGTCDHCEKKRWDHAPDKDGLRLLCPDGSGHSFKWHQTPGRVSISFSNDEAKILDVMVAHTMGAFASVSKTHPLLPNIRRKTMKMRERAEE